MPHEVGVKGLTAAQHFDLGDMCLTEARQMRPTDPAGATSMATIATAHYTAAQAIQTKAHRDGYTAEGATRQSW